MPEQVVEQLIARGWHISFAESCTGGKAAAALVDVADASKVLDVSFVTYANEAKIQYLGVKPETIEEFGVVSEQVAYQMAEGVARQAHSEVGVGITGIAGPTGGTQEKPIGMVCFGFCVDGKVVTSTQYFENIGRNEVRCASVHYAYEQLQELLRPCTA